MNNFEESRRVRDRNMQWIPGGVSSLNRLTEPTLAFSRGEGSKLIDADGNEYIDYHGAFAPHLLGFRHPHVIRRVQEALSTLDLFGAGVTDQEGRLAELISAHIPWIEKIVLVNSGSEATSQAIRMARAATGRNHLILMEGGYNGWHNDVAFNLSTPLERLGPRRSPGEYDVFPLSAGIPPEQQKLIHPINFNDVESVRYVCERYPIAALMTEPILQNVGLIKPLPGYLQALRALADEYGFLLIFDEIKTGFRHGIGGYAQVCGVVPDIVVYGKALASGYPVAMIGGPDALLHHFCHEDPAKRVLLAGTYNAHPLPVAAAIATIEALSENDGAAYLHLEELATTLHSGLERVFEEEGLQAIIIREGSAFVIYFMDHAPVDWHDLATHHDFEADRLFRRALIESGIFVFPMPTKQCSISAAHTKRDIEVTIDTVQRVMKQIPVGLRSSNA